MLNITILSDFAKVASEVTFKVTVAATCMARPCMGSALQGHPLRQRQMPPFLLGPGPCRAS
jgi:hypothetical protein